MDDNTTVKEISGILYSVKGWLKFIGIVMIIGGVVTALSLVGIVVAWVPIWMGVVLYSASNKIEMAFHSGDKMQLMEAFSKLKTYFTIQGIMLILSIAISLFSFLIFGSAMMMMFDSISSSF
ncbi:DUF5362 family protein [Candidatus Cloacimonadota bacterium]